VHQHVRALGQLEERAAARFLLEVEHEAPLAAVAPEVEGRHVGVPPRPELARGVPLRRLDLDHVGAEVTELLGRPRAQHDRGAVENAHAIERSRHGVGSLGSEDAAIRPPRGAAGHGP